LRKWLRARLIGSAASLALAAALIAVLPATRPHAPALVLLVMVYTLSGLVEFLYYLYRGLSRTDLESALTLGHRIATLVCAASVLAWRADVLLLAAAMLLPAAATLVCALGLASVLTTGSSGEPERIEPLPKEFRRDVLPIGFGIVLSALYFRV